MSGHRDSTASAALARAEKPSRPHNRFCHVNGGPRRHGVNGYRCPGCATGPEARELGYLIALDRIAGKD